MRYSAQNRSGWAKSQGKSRGLDFFSVFFFFLLSFEPCSLWTFVSVDGEFTHAHACCTLANDTINKSLVFDFKRSGAE